jgi:hypothetical protein
MNKRIVINIPASHNNTPNSPDGDSSRRPELNKLDVTIQLAHIFDITYAEAISAQNDLDKAGLEIKWKAVSL